MHKLARWATSLSRVVFYALICTGTGLMFVASASYVELGEAHPFILEKLPLRHPGAFRFALYVHVPTALFALPACLVLLVTRVRTRWPRLHRWLGRVTSVLVVGAVCPSGVYLALFAQGGLVSTLGFWLTGLLTFVAMIKSVTSARAGNVAAHRRYGTHVAAQLSVAVVSRFLLVGVETLGLYSEAAYAAALWVPVVGGALAAELVTHRGVVRSWKGLRHEKAAAVPHPHALR